MSHPTSYGTTPPNGNGPQTNGNDHHADEESALLPRSNASKPSRASLGKRFHNHLATPVSQSYVDLVLLASYLITGLLDSTATVLWGSFVSMQTGNSIYVGLGLVDPSGSNRWIKSLLSIVCFSAGSFLFSRFHRIFDSSPRRRWVMITASAIQFTMILGAALIVRFTVRVTPGDEHDLHWHVLVPLGLIAAQSAGQTVASRALGLGTLTSTVLTSIYCDLWSDQKLFAWPTENVERNRRGAAPLLLIAGSALGGLWFKFTDMGGEGALWTAAAFKAAIVLVWMIWKEEKKTAGR